MHVGEPRVSYGGAEDCVVIVYTPTAPVGELLHGVGNVVGGERLVISVLDVYAELAVAASEDGTGHHRMERADVRLGHAHVPATDVPHREHARSLQPDCRERVLVLAQ